MIKIKNNYFGLTGAMGSGKSTILNKLQELEYNCIPEPARLVLKEQRSKSGEGVPEKNPELFNQLMLSKMINDYEENINSSGIFFFDRGLPDLIAYAEHFGIDKAVYQNASQEHRYNKIVFYFPPWKDIYINDDERKMSYELARGFGLNVKEMYLRLGYNIIDVPLVSVDKRAEFIAETIGKSV